MVTYCSNPERGVFSTQTGFGIPKGYVKLTCRGISREGQLMTPEEAQRIGIDEGFLVEFRATESFYELAAHFLRFSPRGFVELCAREEMDEDAVRRSLDR